ncbi:MAG TPA: hypothetical protein VFO65_11760, partial [Acidimicrobiales bacterium]|nr:hypothetical protein [Acidimicrobiales bacterium]
AALGAPAEGAVMACGRGSASRVWTRIRATVLGRPLVEKPGAGTALGACMLAAAGGLHPSLAAAVGAMAPAGRRVEPVTGEVDALEVSYRRFVEALTSRGWWPPQDR